MRPRTVRLLVAAGLLVGVAFAAGLPDGLLPAEPTATDPPRPDPVEHALSRGRSGPSVGTDVPATTLPSYAGGELTVGGPGDAAVLLFFDASCASCPQDLAGLAAVAASTGGRIRPVGVGVDEDFARSTRLVEAAVSPGLVEAVWDGQRVLADALGVRSTPTTIVTDERGGRRRRLARAGRRNRGAPAGPGAGDLVAYLRIIPN